MDALKQAYQQFLDLFGSMTGSQRATLLVVPLMVLVAFGFLMFNDSSSTYVALSWGKLFRTEELIRAEQTLIDAGMNDFHRKGQRLMVPQGEEGRYNAALVDGGGLPNHWAEELEKSLADGGLFQSKAQMQAKMDIVLGKELRRVLRALPEIEDASVKWARSKPARWPHTGSKVTALVSVRPRAGRELSMPRIQSLRYAAASMVPDLEPTNVTVLNQLTGDAYTANDANNPFDGRFLQKVRDITRDYETRIHSALSYIPGVLVTVNVDLENLQRSTERKRTVDSKTVTIQQSETTRKSSSSGRGAAAEPGVVPNQGRTLNLQASNQKSQSTEETDSNAVNLPTVTLTEKDFIAAMPESVQVAVSIPQAYARTVAAAGKQAGADDSATDGTPPTVSEAEVAQAESNIQAKLEPQVLKLIPRGSLPEAVNISFHVPGVPEVEPMETSLLDTAGETAGRWGGAAGLALFALWALWMLNKSMKKVPAVEEADEADVTLSLRATTEDDTPAEITPVERTRRDEIQSVVQDDPELAASVLNKWLQSSH